MKSTTSSSPGKILALVIGGICAALVLLVACAWAWITFAGPGFVQSALTQRTGFPVHSAAFSIDLLGGRVVMKDFEIQNPAEFGGGTFIKIPSFAFAADLGSFAGNRHHIRDIDLHIAEANLVINAQGEKNTDVFARKLQGEQKPGAASASTASKKPQPTVAIDHLRLRFDTARVINMAAKPAKTTAVNLGLNFERRDITDAHALQGEIMAAAMTAGFRNLGPVAVQELTSSALGGATAAAEMTAQGLKAGLTTGQDAANTAAAAGEKAAEKISNAAKSLKDIFKKAKE